MSSRRLREFVRRASLMTLLECVGSQTSPKRPLRERAASASGHDAAVDRRHDAGNETRLIGCEEQKHFRCVCRLTVAAERVHRVEGR
jgi:hypothetical protein